MQSIDLAWITNQGLAIGMLIAIGLGAWRAINWFGKNVVLPMKDSALTHLQETDRTMKANAEATKALTSTIQTMHSDVQTIKTHVERNCSMNGRL
jgi:hypothetical protein